MVYGTNYWVTDHDLIPGLIPSWTKHSGRPIGLPSLCGEWVEQKVTPASLESAELNKLNG